MKNIFKKFIGIVVFEVLVFIPLLLVIWFSDELNAWNNFLIVFAVITVAIWGYIIIVVRDMAKSFGDAVESMKKQNAAIAYKLTGENKKSKKSEEPEEKEKIDISKVNLNPEEPLDPNKNKGKNKAKTKKIDDNYDDFK